MASGAAYLSSIYGTEKDKVNCSFYFKIGACRHGDRCSRKHVKPTFSQTLLIPNVYHNPQTPDAQAHFDLFYEDIWVELATKYGELEELHVCDNVGDHLLGNVYVKFKYEEDALRAQDGLNNRFYAGRPLFAELSPVTDFREACCRQFEVSQCTRGGFCNFMHLREPSKGVRKDLLSSQAADAERFRAQRKAHGMEEIDSYRDRRSPSPRRRDRDDRRGGGGGGAGRGRDSYNDRGGGRGYERRDQRPW